MFLGFVVAVYSGLALLPQGVIAFLVALVYIQLRYSGGAGEAQTEAAGAADTDEEEDF